LRPFSPRLVRFHQILEGEGWRLKLYSISHDGSEIDWARFSPGLSLARAELPAAEAPGRPGLGFVIVHQGLTGDYVVASWWDHENELPTRVFLRSDAAERGWRAAGARESFCVWDLEIMWAERQAYVATALATAGPDLEGYLARRHGVVGERVAVEGFR